MLTSTMAPGPTESTTDEPRDTKRHTKSTFMKRSHNNTLGNVAKSLALALALGGIIYGCGGSGGGGGGGGGTQTADLQAKKVTTEADALAWLSSGDFYKADLSSDFPNGSKGQV